jgi:hypothetical protein
MVAIKRREDRPPSAVRASVANARASLPATFTARLVAVDDAGQAWVREQGDAERAGPAGDGHAAAPPRTQPARSTVALSGDHVGREVLVCRSGPEARLVIVGVLTEPGDTQPLGDPNIDLLVERRRVVIAAKTEVVLRCGEGSITLSADGKVTLRGVDIVSSATRTQRIRGGAVRIN